MRSARSWAALLLLALPACGGSEDSGYDLILVSVDTLRADRLPFYGAERDTGGNPAQPFTPSWLAAQGTLFESCWSTAGQTLPSLANFWTGLPPLEHGAISNGVPFVVPSRLLALRKNRFDESHALVANMSLAPGCRLEQGFDTYAVMAKQDERDIPKTMLSLTQAAVKGHKRLVTWTHFMTPHQPYTPTAELAARYHGQLGQPADNKFLYDRHRDGKVDEALRETVRGMYDGEVRQASDYVREFLSGLDAQYRSAGRGGLLQNAVVVFFADHGEELGDRHGYFMHAKSLYSGVIHVPLLVIGPGWTAGERRAPALELGEVLPMVLDGRTPERTLFFSAWKAGFYAVRDERWTLVHNPGDDRAGPEEPPLDAAYPYPVLALYDRFSDPQEQTDVSAQHPAEAKRLLAELGRWYDGLLIVDSLEAVSDPKVLAALGYVEVTGASARLRPLAVDPWPPQPILH